MPLDDWLRLIVTICGAIFAALSFIVIFTGKRVGKDDGKKNVIKFRGIEFRTNSVLTLVIICMIVFVLPFVLPYFIEKGFELPVSGTVQDYQMRPLKNVTVKLYKNKKVIEEIQSCQQGLFQFLVKNVKKNDRISLNIKDENSSIIPAGQRITINRDSE